MTFFKIVRISFLIGLLALASISIGTKAASSEIDVLQVKGTINPVLVDYLERGITEAENRDAVACIIQIDTPGGLDSSTREIIQDMLNAEIPIVVYVSPSGARAASAGAYITIAAHVAAMAPNTAIGAATPVQLGGEGEAQISEELKAKIINDSAAYMRSLAETHGRNAEWAEKAVREAVSATEQEALELNVIDIVAANLDDLIAQLDGREVTMLDGSVVTLNTEDAAINYGKMNWVEGFLYAIADPNIAYILLSLASLGIFVEITNPGLIFPGVSGAICGIMAFYSLGQLPVNIAGVLLVVLAFGLFIAEVFTATFGLFTAGGITSLVIGSLILFKGGPLFKVNIALIVIIAIIVAALFGFVIQRIIKAHRYQPTTGREELIGKAAVVKVALDPEGKVLHEGELWTAVIEDGQAMPGEEVIITRFDGLKLFVTKKK